MRGSDLVEPTLGMLPRFWRQVVMFVALAVMTIFDWWVPAFWFIHDVAAGFTETWLPVFQSVVERSLE